MPNVTNNTPTAVSDQARQDPDYSLQTREDRTTNPPAPGEVYHATGFGARGTDGTPPQGATAYRNDAPTSDVPATHPRDNEVATNTPSVQPAQPVVQQPALQVTPQTESPDRVTTLETQVSNLGTMLATVSAQLQQLNNNPPQLPGTANPLAPKQHAGSTVQGVTPRTEGPVIPKPTGMTVTDAANQDPLRLAGLELRSGEDGLTTAEYIEKHFRARDMSNDQIAYMCRMDASEVVAILKELGYQFNDGV